MTRVVEPGEVAKPLIREMGYSQECSACSGQYPHLKYVDFDATHDGGWYGGEAQIAKDDLVLCSECVEEGARIVGLVRADELYARVGDLETRLADVERDRDKALEYGDRLEDLMDHRPRGRVTVDHRKKPRNRGVEEVADA